MKKLIAAVLVAVLSVAIIGCGSGETKPQSGGGNTAPTGSPPK